MKYPFGDYWYSGYVKTTFRVKKAIVAVLPAKVARINMLAGLTIKSTDSWLDYKWSKSMTQAIEALYKNDKLFHIRLKVLQNTIAVLIEVTFNNYKY